MTPEQELIEAVIKAERAAMRAALGVQGDPPSIRVEWYDTILTTPSVQAALAKVRGEGVLAHLAAVEVAHAYDATTKPEPVLRWEGNRLYVGAVVFAKVGEGFSSAWWRTVFDGQEYAPTLTEARTAAEQAVKDWLKRAGVV